MFVLMDALVKPRRGPGLELVRVEVPEPGWGEVLIRIRKTAICGTDVHIYNWDPWAEKNISPPLIVGHEYVGEIARLGPGVKGLREGQRVSGEGHIVCGHCRNCRAGNGQWCKNTVAWACSAMVPLRSTSACRPPTWCRWRTITCPRT